MFAVRTEQASHKFESIFGEFRITQPAHRPVHTGRAEVGAWRERHDDVPGLRQQFAHISMMMVAGRFRGQQITRPRFMSECCESIAHRSAIFTSCQDSHSGFRVSGLHST